METEIDRLLTNAVACVDSIKLAGDTFVTALQGMKEAALKCEADLKAEREAADATIGGLRSQIQELKEVRHRAERELAMLQKQIKDDRRQAEYEMEMAQKRIEDANQQVVRIKAEALKLFDAA
jgi:chromosome segregation ATPase